MAFWANSGLMNQSPTYNNPQWEGDVELFFFFNVSLGLDVDVQFK